MMKKGKAKRIFAVRIWLLLILSMTGFKHQINMEKTSMMQAAAMEEYKPSNDSDVEDYENKNYNFDFNSNFDYSPKHDMSGSIGHKRKNGSLINESLEGMFENPEKENFLNNPNEGNTDPNLSYEQPSMKPSESYMKIGELSDKELEKTRKRLQKVKSQKIGDLNNVAKDSIIEYMSSIDAQYYIIASTLVKLLNPNDNNNFYVLSIGENGEMVNLAGVCCLVRPIQNLLTLYRAYLDKPNSVTVKAAMDEIVLVTSTLAYYIQINCKALAQLEKDLASYHNFNINQVIPRANRLFHNHIRATKKLEELQKTEKIYKKNQDDRNSIIIRKVRKGSLFESSKEQINEENPEDELIPDAEKNNNNPSNKDVMELLNNTIRVVEGFKKDVNLMKKAVENKEKSQKYKTGTNENEFMHETQPQLNEMKVAIEKQTIAINNLEQQLRSIGNRFDESIKNNIVDTLVYMKIGVEGAGLNPEDELNEKVRLYNSQYNAMDMNKLTETLFTEVVNIQEAYYADYNKIYSQYSLMSKWNEMYVSILKMNQQGIFNLAYHTYGKSTFENFLDNAEPFKRIPAKVNPIRDSNEQEENEDEKIENDAPKQIYDKRQNELEILEKFKERKKVKENENEYVLEDLSKISSKDDVEEENEDESFTEMLKDLNKSNVAEENEDEKIENDNPNQTYNEDYHRDKIKKLLNEGNEEEEREQLENMDIEIVNRIALMVIADRIVQLRVRNGFLELSNEKLAQENKDLKAANRPEEHKEQITLGNSVNDNIIKKRIQSINKQFKDNQKLINLGLEKEELEKNLNDAKLKNKELEEESNQMKIRNEDLIKRNNSLAEQNNQLREENEQFKKDCEKLTQEKTDLEKEITSLKTKFEEKKPKVENLVIENLNNINLNGKEKPELKIERENNNFTVKGQKKEFKNLEVSSVEKSGKNPEDAKKKSGKIEIEIVGQKKEFKNLEVSSEILAVKGSKVKEDLQIRPQKTSSMCTKVTNAMKTVGAMFTNPKNLKGKKKPENKIEYPNEDFTIEGQKKPENEEQTQE